MEYSYTKNANAPKLIKEVKALNLPGFVGVYTIGQDVRVIFEPALSAGNKNTLDLTVDSHTNDPDPETYVISKIAKAKEFGDDLIKEFGARNVLQGLTTEQISLVMMKLSGLVTALNTGSLNVAVAAIDAIEPDALLTTELIASYRAKIVSFLSTL